MYMHAWCITIYGDQCPCKQCTPNVLTAHLVVAASLTVAARNHSAMALPPCTREPVVDLPTAATLAVDLMQRMAMQI